MSFIPQALGLHQSVVFHNSGLYFVTIEIVYAGIARQGLGWGGNVEEARAKAAKEALSLWEPHLPEEALKEIKRVLEPLFPLSLPAPKEKEPRGTEYLIKILQTLRREGGEGALRKAYAIAEIEIQYQEGKLLLPPDVEGRRKLYAAARKLLVEELKKST